ncbi:hypothetical protein [Paludisphaera soli]|uniref:hypothetical protein n=1 Tax=Paludisphaera soli TaxID=2712865 RepID=UPI0013ED7E3A|nr:hypothetical protein [Paludisphaera soli]
MLRGRSPGRSAPGLSLTLAAWLLGAAASGRAQDAAPSPPAFAPAVRPSPGDLSAPAPARLAVAPEVSTPTIPRPRRVAEAPVAATAPAGAFRADAGDDQIGLVGRRITLNGGRSAPRDELAYRWIPLGGPKMEEPAQEEHYYSFVPTAAGTYRFGLVVAALDGGEVRISEPDEVVVMVGEMPSTVGVGGPGIATAAIDQMLQGPGAAAGRSTLEQSAGVFDAIAARASLYTNFEELAAEMTRRLDGVVPADPSWRQYWSQGIFAPLTQHLTSEMLAAGLDLRAPQGRTQPLAQAQQERLERLFSAYAREFRSKALAR